MEKLAKYIRWILAGLTWCITFYGILIGCWHLTGRNPVTDNGGNSFWAFLIASNLSTSLASLVAPNAAGRNFFTVTIFVLVLFTAGHGATTPDNAWYSATSGSILGTLISAYMIAVLERYRTGLKAPACPRKNKS